MKTPSHPGTSHLLTNLEPLESRIAPAGIVTISGDLKTATWTDVDGDFVTLKATKPIFDATGSQFTFLPQAAGDIGSQLALLDLSSVSQVNKGVGLTFTAKRDAVGHHGDGSVNVGWINATGLDLGAVSVKGDLAAITAGDAALTTPAVTAITVSSAGQFGTATQGAMLQGNPTYLDWQFSGKIGNVTINGNSHVAIVVADEDGQDDGNTLISIGKVTIKGNLVGGDDSLTGFAGIGSGYVFSEGSIGAVFIGGDILGGRDSYAGSISNYDVGTVPSVTVLGDIVGGSASFTGAVQLTALGSLSVGGSIVGGSASDTGEIRIYGTLGKVNIAGSLVGGDTPRDADGNVPVDMSNNPIFNIDAGSIHGSSTIGPVSILGNLQTGEGNFSGAIRTEDGGNISSISIKNSFRGNAFVSDNNMTYRVDNGIYADGRLGAVKIGEITGGDPLGPLSIIAQGKASPTKASDAVAIASVTVARDAYNVEILAGFSNPFTATNPDVAIGAIKIGNSFSGSISAGVLAGTKGFGDAGSVITVADTGEGFSDSGIMSHIASFSVGSFVVGNPWHDMDFVNGVVAQSIGSVKIGGAALELNAGTLGSFTLGATHEFLVAEVA